MIKTPLISRLFFFVCSIPLSYAFETKARRPPPHAEKRIKFIWSKKNKRRNTDNLNNVFIYYKREEHDEKRKNRTKTPLAIFHFDFRYYLYFLCHFKRERFWKSFSFFLPFFFFAKSRSAFDHREIYVRGRQTVTRFVCVFLLVLLQFNAIRLPLSVWLGWLLCCRCFVCSHHRRCRLPAWSAIFSSRADTLAGAKLE